MIRIIAAGYLCCFVSTVNAQEVGTYDQSKQALERFQAFKESLPEKFKEENQNLVLNETYTECAKLYSEDKASALLSPICNSVFLEIAHPLMQSMSNFTASALKDEYRIISDEDKKILQREGLYELVAD